MMSQAWSSWRDSSSSVSNQATFSGALSTNINGLSVPPCPASKRVRCSMIVCALTHTAAAGPARASAPTAAPCWCSLCVTGESRHQRSAAGGPEREENRSRHGDHPRPARCRGAHSPGRSRNRPGTSGHPVSSNDSQGGRQLNRHVEIILSGDDGRLIPRRARAAGRAASDDPWLQPTASRIAGCRAASSPSSVRNSRAGSPPATGSRLAAAPAA